MKWLKRSGLVLGVLVLILAAVPFFVSLNDYIPRIEQEATARLKDPVRIQDLSLSLLPLPHLTVSGISVGKDGMLTAGRVVVKPDLGSLLGTPKVIRSIDVEKLVMTQQALDRIPEWTKGDDQPAVVRIESIKLDDAMVKLEKVTFGPFDARLALAPDSALESASIATHDGKLKALVRPDKDKFLFEASAKEWKLPVGPPVMFDELDLKGVATRKDATFEQLNARLYGGSVSGKAAIAWAKGFQLKGDLDVKQVEVRQLLQALGRPPTMSGRLTARPVFSANAQKPEQIVNVLRVSTPFEVHGGVLHGMDIGKAATSLISKDGAKGGETRFDRLSGHFTLERGTRRLTRLNVASGSLAADGNVTVSPGDELSGRLNATVKAVSVASATVPLNVTGTLQSPLLYPTGGTVAGAALGTAVAGPAGTAIGAKVGQWAEGLFGRKEGGK